MSRKRGMVRARGLAAELKDLREASGLSTREAADRVGVSAAIINRIENAGRAVEPAEVSALLVVYGVTGNERVRIMELAREAEQRGRWIDSGSEYQGAPKQLTALVSFEAEATAITMVNLLVIPGCCRPRSTRGRYWPASTCRHARSSSGSLSGSAGRWC